MGQENRRFLMPHGSYKKIQQLIEERQLYVKPYAEKNASRISIESISRVLKGNTSSSCKKLVNIIYDLAPEVGGVEITHRVAYDRTGT